MPLLPTPLKFTGGFDKLVHTKFDLGPAKSYSVTAWIKTRYGGTIISKANTKWERNAKSFFVTKSGNLHFGVGWGGDISTNTTVNNGKWHYVAATFDTTDKLFQLFVDGKHEASKVMSPGADPIHAKLKMGYTTSDYPTRTRFVGHLYDVKLWHGTLGLARIEYEAAHNQPQKHNVQASSKPTVSFLEAKTMENAKKAALERKNARQKIKIKVKTSKTEKQANAWWGTLFGVHPKK